MNAKIVLKESTKEFDKEYTYSVPSQFLSKICPGARVIVPFGRGDTQKEGYVISVSESSDNDFFVKSILSLELPCPVINDDQLFLVKQICKKYTCTNGDAIRLMVPAQVNAKAKTNRTAFLCNPSEAAVMVDSGEFNKINQIRIIEFLLDCEEALVSDIINACQITQSTLNTLVKKQIITYGKLLAPIVEVEIPETTIVEHFKRTLEQEKALNTIINSESDAFNEYLLLGITGSGKTEVYLQTIQDIIDKGYGAILLVPEISLTPQMIYRMKSRFGEGVCVLHSRLTPKERYEQWKMILEEKVSIVVGARSAVFAPVKDLKLIIVDEEQESTYKSETHPKYHAIDIARMRMIHKNGILILGSATPKVETFYHTQAGKSTLLSLTERIGNAKLPSVEIVDLREELASGNRSIFSRILKKRMLDAFEKKEQVILFLNRRGHSGFYLCRDCGFVPKCLSCSVSLTFHTANNGLICHYCGHIHPVPKKCPNCSSPRIGGFGAGTQKIEELCHQEFPNQTILRMDQDTTVGRGSHARILEQFESGKADILIGTQMIAKGHDFPNVTVVGILSADLMLGMSDFRSSERAFQLITQAAGRAGRGEKNGNVIIQAYNTDDYAVTFAAAQDYAGFYRQEIAFRKAMNYPPFGVIGVIIISSMNERLAMDVARKIHFELTECEKDNCVMTDNEKSVEIMAVAKAPIYKIRDRFRLRIVLKAKSEDTVVKYFDHVHKVESMGDAMISFDLNPYQML